MVECALISRLRVEQTNQTVKCRQCVGAEQDRGRSGLHGESSILSRSVEGFLSAPVWLHRPAATEHWRHTRDVSDYRRTGNRSGRHGSSTRPDLRRPRTRTKTSTLRTRNTGTETGSWTRATTRSQVSETVLSVCLSVCLSVRNRSSLLVTFNVILA